MNPADKLPVGEAAQNNSMSDDEDNSRIQVDLSTSARQTPITTGTTANSTTTNTAIITTAITASTNTTSSPSTPISNPHADMKRSAVKELIERYFYQLQRGCGNPKCSNVNCASSGKVAAMTPNEIAAKAIQLFSQDAKLCDFYTQPPKVPRTGPQHDSPTSSTTASNATTPSLGDLDSSISPQEQTSSSNSSNISSGNSTITSGTSSTSSSSEGSSNTNTFSCATEEMPLLITLGDVVTITTLNSNTTPPKVSGPPTPTLSPVEYLNEQMLDELIDECTKFDSYDRLIHAINEVYCSVEKLSKSFKRPPLAKLTSSATATKLQELLGKSPKELKKEDLRTLEGEHDKDEDSTCIQLNDPLAAGDMSTVEPMDEDGGSMDLDDSDLSSQSSDTQVDLESLRRVKKKLYALNNAALGAILNNNIILLTENIRFGRTHDWEQVLHCFVICFDMATTTSNRFADFDYLERSMPKLCLAAHVMPVAAHARLARIWAVHSKDQLQCFIQCCQQLITLQVMVDEDTVQENSDVIAITKVLKIAFYANILAGELDTFNSVAGATSINYETSLETGGGASSSASGITASNEMDDIFFYTQVPRPHYPAFAEDKLEKELNVSCMDCRVPLVPFEEFYNEPLSDAIQMDRDYLSYKNLSLDPLGEDNHFSFMLYSFILTPAAKVVALYYDSRIRMYSERNSSLYSLLNYFGEGNDMGGRPDLKLKVRRDSLVDDALIGLELVAMSNPKDLKKQLVVEFVGEQGIDEGGVSKEFFQLIIEEIFNPNFGMFTHQEETNTMWFNSAPFENEAQFTLIGIILGLAIYNNIILAVNFPMVVYRKLMGGQGTFYDLKDWNPTLYRSLKSLLDYQESDMEEVFMQTFKISYKTIFDEVIEHELKPGGSEITVGQHNKQEFVDLYSDFLLNKNIERQFRAFKRGFEMVTDESPLRLLFRPEEIELLVCGSRKFDFVELEKSTEYEGGYSNDTQIIKDFWSIVHSLPEESKRKLLEFTTGSDRVPVGGLSRLRLLITRHGPDSDRLPTSHTCFNVLLLPEYSSKAKLEERLLKAINYSKGFGML
uniref:Ubiquitin-protein ligase E3A n=1 Tax=Glossina palpalis gambiensis TaxID=67801 RepID=A0A1B0BD53_9MUSC